MEIILVGSDSMKKLRVKAGYTQKQLAIRIGVSQSYISKIEKGKIDGMTIDKLLKLADALQVTPAKLLNTLLRRNKKCNTT